MASSHNAERISKSEGVKVVKMNFTEEDLRAAKIARLEEIKAECLKANGSVVYLTEISQIVMMQTDSIKNKAKKLGIKIFSRNNPSSKNKPSLCISEEDAEKLMRSIYAS